MVIAIYHKVINHHKLDITDASPIIMMSIPVIASNEWIAMVTALIRIAMVMDSRIAMITHKLMI